MLLLLLMMVAGATGGGYHRGSVPVRRHRRGLLLFHDVTARHGGLGFSCVVFWLLDGIQILKSMVDLKQRINALVRFAFCFVFASDC